MTSTASAVIAVTDLPTSFGVSDGADRDAVRPSENRLKLIARA